VYTQLKKRRRPNHAVIFIISLFLSAMISYLSQCYPPRHLLSLSPLISTVLLHWETIFIRLLFYF
jgi:hypothetical protein